MDLSTFDLSTHDLRWYNAFTLWHNKGDKSLICQLLREGEPLDRDDGILLAAIISGEWKRPKVVGRGFVEQVHHDIDTIEVPRCRVMRLKDELAIEAKRKGQMNPEPYRAALEAIAPAYHLSPDGLDKRIRKTKYKKKSSTAYKLLTMPCNGF